MRTGLVNKLKNKKFNLSEEKNKIIINQKKLYDIYKKEFIDECETIIIEKKKIFLDKYFTKIHLIIKNEYGSDILGQNSILKEIKKCESNFINKIYSPMYKSCFLGLKKYNSKKVHNATKEYLTNFLPHCSFDQVPLHICGSKFIYINNINNKGQKTKDNISYVLCIGCHKCYYYSCIKMYCPYCQMKFYSHLIEKNKDNIYPATWKKYHCDEYMNNEQMTCVRCNDKLWVKDDILICKNCNLEVKPEEILWTCAICKEEFKSKVKIYNKLEFKEINYEIKNALLYKKIVKPKELPCKCLSINQINNIDFDHKSYGNCKGLLYYGSIDNKEFVVCSICKKMTFLNKFYWNCPKCNKKFITKRIKCFQTYNNDNNLCPNIKFKKNQNNIYSHIANINSCINTKRNIKKNESFKIKNIETNNSNNKNNITFTDKEDIVKKRNNSLIMPKRYNNIVFTFDNNYYKKKSKNHLMHDKKNNTSSTTIYSSVSYNNSSSREFDKETHKKIRDNNLSQKLKNIFNKNNLIFSIINEYKKNNLSLSNDKENLSINNSLYNISMNKCNDIKKDSISSFNLRKRLKNENKICNKLSFNDNISGSLNKKIIPKKGIINNLSISINKYLNNNNNKYINIFNLKTNDTYENSIFNNKSRNLSGPKTYNTKKIKKSKNKINNNNNYNKSEFRISSQPKTGNNKINHAFRNKKIKIDSKSNINLISYNNININKINNSKKNINNKKEKEIEKEIFYRKERKNQNNSFIYSNYKENKSFISKDIKNIKKKIENYYNNSNSMKYFENSIKKITIKNSNEDAQIKNDREEKEDELKEFNFEEYKIITQLGQGTFGKIYLVQDKSKQLFSMKKIILSEELDVQSVIKEYRMCYKIKHPNVIKILGIYNNKLDKTTYVVYVLMEVGLTDWEKEIKSYIDKHLEYTEEELINIIKQLTSILAFLQKQNICHRDIKPQNILVFKKKFIKLLILEKLNKWIIILKV